MRHEITKTENYLLILDNGSKEGDYIFHNNTIGKLVYNHYDGGDCYDVEIGTGVSYEIHEPLNIVKKIIAHLPLNNSSVLEGVDLLPSLEEDVVVSIEGVKDLSSFVRGYDKATNKYDVIITKLFNHLYDKMESISQEQIDKDSFQLGRYRTYKQVFEFIQSLSKPKIPIGFECEYQSPEDRYYEDGVGYTHNVKRINNSQGQTQWVGKYIYE